MIFGLAGMSNDVPGVAGDTEKQRLSQYFVQGTYDPLFYLIVHQLSVVSGNNMESQCRTFILLPVIYFLVPGLEFYVRNITFLGCHPPCLAPTLQLPREKLSKLYQERNPRLS